MNCSPVESLPAWLKLDGPKDANTWVLFAHGAGADMDSDFMLAMAKRLAAQNMAVVRFNFPYMQQRLVDGKRRPPNRTPALTDCFAEAIDLVIGHFAPRRLCLMGKSMGGRMAAIMAGDSQIAQKIAAVICLGYPFLPPKGKEVRLAPLQLACAPLLIIQGERDSFGNKEQVANWDLPASVNIHWLKDGDHSFVPRKSSGCTEAANLDDAARVCAQFIAQRGDRDE